VSSHTITTSFSRQTVKQQAEEISVDKLNIAIAEKAAYRAGRRGLTTIFCFFSLYLVLFTAVYSRLIITVSRLSDIDRVVSTGGGQWSLVVTITFHSGRRRRR